jgi:hypothetical protein
VPAHEDRIRDELSTRLNLIEPDLSLIAINYALLNSEGTRGFIDLLARDRHGVLVVIELKRSNSTAREALHEVMKYTELLQREQGIESHNIRAIIISTHWDELRVPFSHFKRGWENEIRGYTLTLAEDQTTPVEVEEVRPLADMPNRGITPVHLIVFGGQSNSLDVIWQESVQTLAEVGADDVLAVEFNNRSDGRSFLYMVIGVMIADDPRTAQLDDLADEIPDDTIEVPEGYALEYRALCHLSWGYNYEQVEIEIAYPDKFGSIQADPHWQLVGVRRTGIFARQADLYPDETLVERIYFRAGHSEIQFNGSSRPANQAHYVNFRNSLARCIGGIEAWRGLFFAWLDEIAAEAPERDVLVHVYNPCDFIGALVHGWPDDVVSYLPSLRAAVDAPQPDGRLLTGTLTWDGNEVNILNAVHSMYAEPFEWVIESHVAIPWEKDLALLTGLGLDYSLFEWSDEYRDGALLTLVDGNLTRTGPDYMSEDGSPMWNSVKPLPDFFQTHAQVVDTVANEFKSVVSFPQPDENEDPF